MGLTFNLLQPQQDGTFLGTRITLEGNKDDREVHWFRAYPKGMELNLNNFYLRKELKKSFGKSCGSRFSCIGQSVFINKMSGNTTTGGRQPSEAECNETLLNEPYYVPCPEPASPYDVPSCAPAYKVPWNPDSSGDGGSGTFSN